VRRTPLPVHGYVQRYLFSISLTKMLNSTTIGAYLADFAAEHRLRIRVNQYNTPGRPVGPRPMASK
jgi:hypothetical protein